MLATTSGRDGQSSSARENLHSVAQRLLKQEIEFIDSKEFRKSRVVSELLEADPFEILSPIENDGVKSELPAHLARMCDVRLLSAEEERDLFRRMNFYKYRANVLRAKVDVDDLQEDLIDELESLIEKSEKVRDHLIQANMRLVISIVKKFVSPSHSFDELLSDGTIILMNAVEKFDFERGYRFSTYAYRSIARNAYRKVNDRKKEFARYAAVPEETIEGSIEQGNSASMDEKTWERLRGMLGKFLCHLDKRERLIVKARYALGQHRTVQTFQSIADKLGVSKERVRQLEQRAVGKLKNMASELTDETSLT